MRVRLAINPLTWTNDDMPELGAATPLETCLAEARWAGFEGVELGNKFPREAAILAPILARHGLALASGWYGARLLERDAEAEWRAARGHVGLLRALGCTAMVHAEVTGAVHGMRATPLSHRPVLTDAQWDLLAPRLETFAQMLAGEGLRLAYHHHMGTLIQTEAEIDRLLAMTDASVGLLLDTGHLAFAGGDPAAVASRHAGRIAHVHCKDLRAGVLARMLGADASFLDAVLAGVFTVPGDGAIDYAPVLAALAAGGYAGWLVVEAEQDPARAHPLGYAALGHANLARLALAAFSPPAAAAWQSAAGQNRIQAV